MRQPIRFRTGLLSAVLVCSSCALFRGKPEPYPTGLIFPLTVDGQLSYPGEINGLIQRTPAGLVLSTKKGAVLAVDEAQRKILWTYKIPEAVELPPVVGAEGLTVCDRTSELYRLSFKGDLVWKVKPKGRIVGQPIEADGVLYLGMPGGIAALSAIDGAELWRVPLKAGLTAGPLLGRGLVLAGDKDGTILGLSRDGRTAWTFAAPAPATALVGAAAGRLFYGAEDGCLHAVPIGLGKESWKVKTNGPALEGVLVVGKRLIFLTANNVLYCLNRGCGNILWWQAVPGRPGFDLTLAGDRVVVATQSPTVVAFDIKTGLKIGEYQQDLEARSNALWADPLLVSSAYDQESEQGRLDFLKKEIKLTLNASRPSPIKDGDDVTIEAVASGLFKPTFEFSLKTGDQVEVVQAASEESKWTWYDARAGTYTIQAKAVDEKTSVQAELTYEVQKPAAASRPSPPAKAGAEGAAPAAAPAAPPETGAAVEKKGAPIMTRNEALELVKANLPNPNLVKHSLAVEACMKAVAARLGQDPETWGMAGLLHDLDYEKTAKSPDLHTTETLKMLEGRNLPPEVIHAIQAHAGKVPCESPMDWAIYSIDPLTGLIIAATLMHPDKKLASIDLEFVKRRYKEKSFAKGARRDEIEKCVNTGIGLDEFIAICIKAMQGIAGDLGL
jgi:putative nucleotidyltransferase with HDIG domain